MAVTWQQHQGVGACIGASTQLHVCYVAQHNSRLQQHGEALASVLLMCTMRIQQSSNSRERSPPDCPSTACHTGLHILLLTFLRSAAMPCTALRPFPAQGFALDNSWLDRLDMGFDLGDILSEGPSDGLVPTISDVEPFADALDASVPSLSFFKEQEVQQAPAPAPAQQQQFHAAIADPVPVPAAVLPVSPMLSAQQPQQQQQQVFGGMMGFPEFMPQQQMEQQVPSLMQQQYVVRGDMVNALPQMSMIPSMHTGGMLLCCQAGVWFPSLSGRHGSKRAHVLVQRRSSAARHNLSSTTCCAALCAQCAEQRARHSMHPWYVLMHALTVCPCCRALCPAQA